MCWGNVLDVDVEDVYVKDAVCFWMDSICIFSFSSQLTMYGSFWCWSWFRSSILSNFFIYLFPSTLLFIWWQVHLIGNSMFFRSVSFFYYCSEITIITDFMLFNPSTHYKWDRSLSISCANKWAAAFWLHWDIQTQYLSESYFFL